MDPDHVRGRLNTIFYGVDYRVQDLSRVRASECAGAMFDGYFTSTPEEFVDVLETALSGGLLPDSDWYSRRFGDEDIRAFMRFLLAELRARIAGEPASSIEKRLGE